MSRLTEYHCGVAVIKNKELLKEANISSQDIAVESSSPWKEHVMQRFTRSE